MSFSSFTLFRSSVNPGDLVVCHDIKGFEGERMPARVLCESSMHRPAQKGMVWVRELRGLKERPKGWEAFVTEWPIARMS